MWVARDKDGVLCAFENKPYRQTIDNMWIDSSQYLDYKYDGVGCMYQMEPELFPNLTWENDTIQVKALKSPKNKNLNKSI